MALDQVDSGASKSTPKRFHLFGRGVSWSISPTIHNTGFQHYGLPYLYDIRESEHIEAVADLIQSPEFGGASVTMPHKLEAHSYCDEQSETAALIGAINTLEVKYGDDGSRKIIGDNTDWSGLHALITAFCEECRMTPRVGLVIGAGGASRAALYALHRAGAQQIYIVNRTLSTAERVREDFKDVFKINVAPSIDALMELPDIIIGTIPAEKTTEAQFTSLFSSKKGLCIDMSYKPRLTPLLSAAHKNGQWQTVDGVEVLFAQGFQQFQHWTGREPPKQEMIEAVKKLEQGREEAKKDEKL